MVGSSSQRALAERLGKVGVWTFAFDHNPVSVVRDAARTAEGLGYGTLWFPESAYGREAMTNAAIALAATETIRIGTGVARAANRSPQSTLAASLTLAEAYPGRFILGLGGATQLATGPIAGIRGYLDEIDGAPYGPGRPALRPPMILAALGPRMLDLAKERADGVQTYLVPVAHTRIARARLGSEPLLVVEQAAIVGQDRETVLRWGRDYIAGYHDRGRGPYAKMLLNLGFTPTDLESGGSEGLVDAVIASGGPEAIAARIRDHLEAGADHVCVQPIGPDRSYVASAEWSSLMKALGDLSPGLREASPQRAG